VHREDRCNSAITPGHLVEFNANDRLQVHSTSGGKAATMFAKEADFIGNSVTTAYASGDRVPYAECAPGTVVWAHLASGQNVARGDYLSSNGAGALTAYTGSAAPVAQADEDANASSGIAAGGTLRFRARVV
jgi:hypothetical protein